MIGILVKYLSYTCKLYHFRKLNLCGGVLLQVVQPDLSVLKAQARQILLPNPGKNPKTINKS